MNMSIQKATIKRIIGVVFLTMVSLVSGEEIYAQSIADKTKVVVARGSDIQKLLDKALAEFGGIESFMKHNNVVIKPDISRNAHPSAGLTTDPNLVKYLIRSCYTGDPGVIFVIDHCVDEWTKCYKNSGIERVAKDESAKVYPGNSKYFYREKTVTGGKALKKIHVHQTIVESGVLINVPILKNDPYSGISGGLKNLKGCVNDWDFYQTNGLDQCIAEFLYFKKPELTIIDASKMINNLSDKKYPYVLIVGTNVVATDATACRLVGIDPEQVEHLKIASTLGFGSLREEDVRVVNVFQ